MPKVKASFLDNDKMNEMQNLAHNNLDNEEVEEVEDLREKSRLGTLSDLVMLGKLISTFKVKGFEFKISTLSASEQSSVIRDLMKADDVDRILFSKAIALSYAVKEINSVALSELSSEHDGETEKDRNLSFILDMQTNLVDKIFSEYESLNEKSQQEVGLEDIKK